MNLWLLRHGEAEQLALNDPERNLTRWGQQEVAETAQKLCDIPLDIVLNSPYKRAIQTAELVCQRIGYTGEVKEIEWITPDSDPKQAINFLEAYEGKNILIVSHQPFLGNLAGLLTEGSPAFALPLKTAELVHLIGENISLASMHVKNY